MEPKWLQSRPRELPKTLLERGCRQKWLPGPFFHYFYQFFDRFSMFFGGSLRPLLPSFLNLIFARLFVSTFCWIAFVSGARKKAHTRFTPQNTIEFIDFQGARLHRRRRQDKENMENTTNNKLPTIMNICCFSYFFVPQRSLSKARPRSREKHQK